MPECIIRLCGYVWIHKSGKCRYKYFITGNPLFIRTLCCQWKGWHGNGGVARWVEGVVRCWRRSAECRGSLNRHLANMNECCCQSFAGPVVLKHPPTLWKTAAPLRPFLPQTINCLIEATKCKILMNWLQFYLLLLVLFAAWHSEYSECCTVRKYWNPALYCGLLLQEFDWLF